jgi:hypothetical protein
MTPTKRPSDSMTGTWSSFTARMLNWAVPAVMGAFFVLLLNSSGEREISRGALERVAKLETQLSLLERDLASGGPPALSRRVDDLSNTVQRQFEDVSKKLDAIQSLLVRGR